MTVRIVTDSTSDLPPTLASQHEIEVVPLNVHFANEVYKDGTEITADQFFEKLIKGPIYPTTSQPSIGEFIDIYKKIAEKGDEIVSIHISKILSGTYNSALQASKNLEDEINIHVVDSEKVSMSLGLSAIAAAQAAKNGGSVEEVISAAESAADRGRFVALFDTLEYLAKGGRIGKAQSLLGGLLKIRPILTVEMEKSLHTLTHALERLDYQNLNKPLSLSETLKSSMSCTAPIQQMRKYWREI